MCHSEGSVQGDLRMDSPLLVNTKGRIGPLRCLDDLDNLLDRDTTVEVFLKRRDLSR